MTKCCPDTPRIEPLRTVSGLPVSDAHKHEGMVRGFVDDEGKQRLLFWYRNGRLTPLAEMDWDLRRVAG